MTIVNLTLKKAIAFLLLVALFGQPAYAQTKLSLSDEIYADIALRGYLNNVSVSLYNRKTGESIGINETKHWLPASTVKLFAAMYAYNQVYLGKLSLNASHTVDAKNVVPTESVDNGLPTVSEGQSVTLSRLIQLMITQSDNSAFNQMLDILDRRQINDYLQKLGLVHSGVGSKLNLDESQTQYEFDVPGYGINTTTAEDYTKAFSMILDNKVLGSKDLVAVLKQQKINYMLPLYLPKDVTVAHKHGDLDPLYHDGGIIFGPNNSSPYVLSIFSNVGDPDVVAHLSELIYTKDPRFVGSPVTTPKPLSQAHPPIDPMVARGTFDSDSKVLAAQTSILNTQPITASDLGITASDISLAQPAKQLPEVIIPADSPLHFLVNTVHDIERASVDDKTKAQVDIDAIQTQIAEAKDLLQRGKTSEANAILDQTQKDMNNLSQSSAVKNDAQAQIQIQALSDDRFQILGKTVQSVTGAQKEELIKKVAQQARETVEKVQPNLPLASNAVNVTQRPLIGEVVGKNSQSIIVQTAGGQQLTIPINNPDIKVKTKEIPTTIAVTPVPQTSETPQLTATPAPTQNASLASLEKGTTVALVGSSVGNTFIPTFILKDVPRELVAPEPVTVVKVNEKDKTMVIAENGVPVQVNVSSKTVIKGADTSIGFDQIKPGDTVVVHGEPLTPVAPTPSPKSPPSIFQQLLPTQKSQPGTTTPAPTQGSSATLTPQPSTKSSSQTTLPNDSVKAPNGQVVPLQIQTTQTGKIVPASNQTKNNTPSQNQAPVAPAPKVIQSTSIQVIEKKENVPAPAQSAPSNPKPAPAPAEHHDQPAPQHAAPQSNPPPQSAPATTTNTSAEKKK